MNANVPTCRCRYRWAALSLLGAAVVLWAAEGRAKTGDYQPGDKTVDMFEAIENGDIAVQLIPKDSTQCRVLIRNKTDQPLNVKLPEAFAGVPALAQAGAGKSSSSSGKSRHSADHGGRHGRHGHGRRHGWRHGHVQRPARARRTIQGRHRLPRTRQERAAGGRFLMKSSRWKASRPSPASAKCAKCWPAGESTSGLPKRPPGT